MGKLRGKKIEYVAYREGNLIREDYRWGNTGDGLDQWLNSKFNAIQGRLQDFENVGAPRGEIFLTINGVKRPFLHSDSGKADIFY